MKSRALLLLLIPIFAVACAALAGPGKSDDDEREAAIEFKEAPKAVQGAIRKVTKIDAITELEKITQRGIAVYDVEYTL